jgi:hypothetical protein
MTVSSTTSRIDYTGSGSSTYAYPFYIFANTDLAVYVNGVLKTLTTDYTVTGAGSLSGGNVVFVASVSGLAISIQRNVSATQTTDYVANDPFPAETHEAALDKVTMLCQQLIEKVGRALKVKSTSLQVNLDVDDLVAGKFLQVKTPASSGIQMVDIVTSGAIGIPVSIAQGGTGQITAAAALAALGGIPTYMVKVGSKAGDYTTSSAAFVNVDGTNLSYTVVIPVGWKLFVVASLDAYQSTAGNGMYFALFDNGGTIDRRLTAPTLGTSTGVSLNAVVEGDGASHTITLVFATANVLDATNIRNASTGWPQMVFILSQAN